MSTSFRISQTGKPTPAGGLLGAMGMTTSSDALDIVAETDDLNDVGDIVNFIQDVAGTVSGAYIRTLNPDYVEAAVVQDPDDEPDTTDHDEAAL